MNSSPIGEKLKNLPGTPGVYIFKGRNGTVIYVGSSSCLKKRVLSYFLRSLDGKTARLAEEISDINYIATDSLKEALLLEDTLIKKHKPKYNIKLKDDKKYPFIAITADTDFPFIQITRKTGLPHHLYFGPYTGVKKLRKTFQMVRKLFKLRTCKMKIPSKKIKGCLSDNIGLCSAPCVSRVSQKEYGEAVNEVINFLNGKTARVIKELRLTIARESKLLNFEKCAYCRNVIQSITELTQTQKVFFARAVDADYIGITRAGETASLSVLRVRGGRLVEENNFIFLNPLSSPDGDVIASFIKKIYSAAAYIPPKIYTSADLPSVEGGFGFDAKLVPANLSPQTCPRKLVPAKAGSGEQGTKISAPKSGINREIVELAEKNAALKMPSVPEDAAAKAPGLLREIKDALRLKNTPFIIKAVDVSNISGKFATGSVVCFTNGKPDKNQYRHYIIKCRGERCSPTVGADPQLALSLSKGVRPLDNGQESEINDYAMIAEILGRNLKHKKNWPDLLIIDGGKGHLNTALRVLREMNISDIDIISIAKKEELIYKPDRSAPINLRRDSKILHLIQHIRDEAHRFAVGLHRKRRGILGSRE